MRRPLIALATVGDSTGRPIAFSGFIPPGGPNKIPTPSCVAKMQHYIFEGRFLNDEWGSN
jgi:hypothetical protein